MKKIVFVCTGNTCRSPMAMAVAEKMFAEQSIKAWTADSAGLACNGGKISDNSVKALKKMDINLSDYRSKQLSAEMVNSAEILAVMTESHKAVLESLGVPNEKIIVLGGGIPDPYGGDEALYENCLEKIISGINNLLKEGVFR